ncbi:hypothetical protein OIO90_002115 [Microbotryomycetes sp. JL221]|nr:hypothetical protein OIO90_002115 [Microbotryomycetes sp. JL221]
MEPLPLDAITAERVRSRLSTTSEIVPAEESQQDDKEGDDEKDTTGNDRDLHGSTPPHYDPEPLAPVSSLDAARKFISADFTEGGLQGWLNVAGSFMILFATFGYVNAFGAYQSYYQLNFLSHKSASDIAWIGSTGLAIEYSMAFIAGPLFDRGYFRTLIIVGSLGFTFCLFMTSLCKEYWQIMLAQGIGLGLSMGCQFMPSASVLAHYFYRRRSLAMGIAMAGSSLGGIIFPIMLNQLFPRVGFGSSVRASAYLVLGLFIIAILIMKPRYPAKPETSSALNKSQWSQFKYIFKETRYQLTVAAITMIVLGSYYPVTFIQTYAELSGMPPSISNNILAILNSSSFCGRILLPAVADELGAFNTLIISTSGASALIFALYGVSSPASVIVFALLYGFFSGGIVSLISPVLIATANNIHEIGTRQGCGFIVNGLAALACAPIAGALLEAGGGDNFKYSTAFAGGVIALGSALLFVARCYQSRLLGKSRV